MSQLQRGTHFDTEMKFSFNLCFWYGAIHKLSHKNFNFSNPHPRSRLARLAPRSVSLRNVKLTFFCETILPSNVWGFTISNSIVNVDLFSIKCNLCQ